MDDERFNRSLIDAVSIKAFLFNPYHPDRKNKLKQENAWKKIAASLNSTVSICQTRWFNLRSTYCRKHKKIMSTPSRSATQPKEQWTYFSQLSFLDGYVKHKASTDNLSFSVGLHDKEELPRYSHETSENRLLFEDLPDSESSATSCLTYNEPSPALTTAAVNATDAVQAPCKRKRKSNEPDLKNELVQFLRSKENQLEQLNNERKRDRFDDFAAFVASEL